jgi:6,7-dimethyl-8-ribityllumazine synthase
MADHSLKGLTAASTKLDGSALKVLIGKTFKVLLTSKVHTRWNISIIEALTKGCHQELLNNGVKAENITIKDCPGAYELPFACQTLLEKGQYDVAIAIGCLIKGGTMHFEYICEASSHGLMRVQLDTKIPCIFGILTCLTEDQAKLRAGIPVGSDKGHNHGPDWATTAIEMALMAKM